MALYQELFFNIEKVSMGIHIIFQDLSQSIKKLLKNKKGKLLLIFAPIAFIFFIYGSISYNSKLKRERVEKISSFLSSNETILLKNYVLNQIK